MSDSVLKSDLKNLARRFDERGIKLILAGGYGLIEKHRYVRREHQNTLCGEIRHLNPRSTMDLDLFLEVKIIADANYASWLRDEIMDLDYKPSVKYFQFRKTISSGAGEADVEIDLLCPPPGENDDVHIKGPRVRAKSLERDSEKLHAYRTDEAFTVNKMLTRIPIEGEKKGQPNTFVYLPNPFSYLILKVFAFRDRNNRADGAESRKEREEEWDKAMSHAFDTYIILAMTTEKEWKKALKLSENHKSHDVVIEARRIISKNFSKEDQPGMIAIKEHGQTSSLSLEKSFLEEMPKHLKELFK